MSELIEEIRETKEGITEPESYRDIHLLVFVLQTVILFIFSLLLFNMLAEDEKMDIMTDKGLVSSYIHSFRIEKEDKTFVKLPSLEEDMDDVVNTGRFLDLKNGGVWLSQDQEAGIICTYFALVPTAIVCLLLGIGRMYKRLREPYFDAMRNTFALLVLPPLGVAVLGAISMFFWFIVSAAALLVGPLMYLFHLMIGIYQVKRRITH